MRGATDPVSLEDVEAAARRIQERVHRTPVLTSRTLDRMSGRQLFFKAENLQRCGAFKARGAMNAVLRLSEDEARRGVLTDSSGNHGQALAWAAAERGIPATVVMPADAPAVKRQAVEGYGAAVVLCPPTLEGRAETIARLREESGAVYVPPFDHPDIIAGQGTLILELLEQAPALDAILVPVGGGGLIAGCAIAGQGRSPGLRVFGAEPLGANDAARSRRAGERLAPVNHRTVAGGLLVGLGKLTWPVVRDRVEAIIELGDDEILAATRLVWERMKLLVEPSGAVTVAAALSVSFRETQGLHRVGVVLSGGNVDLDRLPWALDIGA